MSNRVKVKVEVTGDAFWEIFLPNPNKLFQKPQTEKETELETGNYNLAYKIRGEPGTTYKVYFCERVVADGTLDSENMATDSVIVTVPC